MADTSRTELRTSKRKRAQVNYYEEPASDDEELTLHDEENEEVKESSRPKKCKSVSSKPLPKKKIFPFLELPGELRNKIYNYCLHDPAGVYLFAATQKYRRTVSRGAGLDYYGESPITHSTDDENDEQEEEKAELPSDVMRPFVPALLAVCKKINEEARGILYDHVFHVRDSMTLHSFLVDLGPRGATYLKNVELGEWGHGRGVNKAYNHACFTALAAATNLEKFTFHGILSWSSDPKPRATRFYRDAFPWLEAIGAAKGKADAAVDLVDVRVQDPSSYYYYRRGRARTARKFSSYEDIDLFREELAKLLNARMDRIRS